ncbi:MAG: NUDIX domain-containing protein [Saprospiraceae bacterium]|nr:NUDIX domain-containing protein [Saprospiraceae bacterium]
MYKIYINDHPLILAQKDEVQNIDIEGLKPMPYMGVCKHILNYIDKLEKSTDATEIVLYSEDLEELWKDFKSLFKKIKAAGGVIYNRQRQILMIDRLQRWDLPKGKLEKGEKKRDAALREVLEETGLQCSIIRKVGTSFHTYRTRKGRILKKTYWYEMQYLSGEIKLQHEEDIVGSQWVPISDFLASNQATYNSIRDVLMQADKYV